MVTAQITGYWVSEYQYRMHDPRTNEHRLIFVAAMDGGTSEPEEVEDVVAEYKERFAEEVKDMPTHQTMPIQQQHEFAPHLRSIEESKRRMRETGNRRYH